MWLCYFNRIYLNLRHPPFFGTGGKHVHAYRLYVRRVPTEKDKGVCIRKCGSVKCKCYN